MLRAVRSCTSAFSALISANSVETMSSELECSMGKPTEDRRVVLCGEVRPGGWLGGGPAREVGGQVEVVLVEVGV